ncbi:MAG: low molecular weight phosphotyrosine protein phosphatase [Saprospiraceae bacterium]|nr:low molecular weight phosphotyrosine protein phosphatase [Saprospiraceae bacterium]MDW8485217.1 low molecular weight protein-tyrosine-phosphatase [Saprospiraceae bacterium]
MVCLGNICRSPLAEGILKHKARQHNLNWWIDSAGTSAWHVGELPDPRTIEVARRFGIDITDQRARQISLNDFEQFDLIFAMDRQNLRDLREMAPSLQQKQKIRLLLDVLYPGQEREVPDPYYGGIEGFVEVFRLIERACDQIIAQYKPK